MSEDEGTKATEDFEEDPVGEDEGTVASDESRASVQQGILERVETIERGGTKHEPSQPPQALAESSDLVTLLGHKGQAVADALLATTRNAQDLANLLGLLEASPATRCSSCRRLQEFCFEERLRGRVSVGLAIIKQELWALLEQHNAIQERILDTETWQGEVFEGEVPAEIISSLSALVNWQAAALSLFVPSACAHRVTDT